MWNHRESLGGHVGHARQVVDDAGVRRSRRGHDADDVVAARIVAQRGTQRGAGQPVVLRRPR